MAAKKKTVNVAKNVNSAARQINTMIQHDFLKQMRLSNIPAFGVIAKKITLQQYFVNRELFINMLGNENTDIADNFLRHAIARCAANEIRKIMEKSAMTYPGYWDYELDTLTMIYTNLVPIDGVPDCILTTLTGKDLVTREELEELDRDIHAENSFMVFTNYSVDGLYLMIQAIANTVFSLIVNTIKLQYPKMMVSDSANGSAMERWPLMLGRDLPAHLVDTVTAAPTEAMIISTIGEVEKLITNFFVQQVAASGLGEEAIKNMLSKMSLNDLYDLNGKKTMGDVKVTQVFAVDGYYNADHTTLQTAFEFTFGDLAKMVQIAQETERYSLVSRSTRANLGTKMKKAIDGFINMVISISIDDYTNGTTSSNE